MIENQKTILNKKEFLISTIIWLLILIIGGILLLVGLNEAFYVENESVRKVFEIITNLGGDNAFIFLLALVFFATDKEYSRKLLTGFFITLYFNLFLKFLVNDPRPSTNIGDDLLPIEEGPGFPSGHTQNSVGYWGYTYLNAERTDKKNIIQIICIILLILVPISRLIIGVHDLQDVIGGYVIGIVILQIYMLADPKLQKLKENKKEIKIVLGVVISLLLWIIAFIAGTDAVEEVSQPAGLLIATSIGYPLMDEKINFDPKDFDGKQKLISAIIGIIFTFAFYMILTVLFGLFPDELAYIHRFIRYIILGLLLTLVIPIIIKKILKIE